MFIAAWATSCCARSSGVLIIGDFRQRRLVLEQLLAGVSTRRFERSREPVGERWRARRATTSKSAVSREFVVRTRRTWKRS
jgi:hypothetical protein